MRILSILASLLLLGGCGDDSSTTLDGGEDRGFDAADANDVDEGMGDAAPDDGARDAPEDTDAPDADAVDMADAGPPDPCEGALGLRCDALTDSLTSDYLKAFNTEEMDAFGTAVAADGDVIAVGAPREDSDASGVDGDQDNNEAPDRGAVYVYRRDPVNGWEEEAYLKPPEGQAIVRFGTALALEGNTLVVGGSPSFVFEFGPAGWSQTAELRSDNFSPIDNFGVDVDISDDRIAIGAHFESGSGSGIDPVDDDAAGNSGAVYVFVRTDDGWTQEAYIKASNTDRGDQFGKLVALDGDVLAVGAPVESSSATGVNGPQDNNDAPFTGAVYVFRRGAGGWAQEAYIKAENPTASPTSSSGVGGDRFGNQSLAVFGDTIVVGVPEEDSDAVGVGGDDANDAAPQSGAVFVYRFDGDSSWALEAYLKASNSVQGVLFGWSVAMAPNLIAASSPIERSAATSVGGNELDDTATSAGAVYLFARVGSEWTQVAYVKASNTQREDRFGWSLDFGERSLVVGADQEDSDATGVGGDEENDEEFNSGAAYAFGAR
ncbi:MAG: integrin [Myxococcota bacterium]